MCTKKFVLVILIFVCASATFADENLTKEAEAVKDVITQETNCWKDSNYEGWAETWVHAPYIFWVNSGVTFYNEFDSWEALDRRLGRMLKNRKEPREFKVERKNYNIRIFGDGAWATFDQHNFYQSNGNEVEDVSKGFRTLEKIDGEWKIIFMGDIAKSEYFDTSFVKIENFVNGLGYKLLQINKIDEAVKMFKLNVDYFPDSWNVYDSLGEAFMKKGEKEKAIRNYKKSLELNPENKTAEKMIKKLRKIN